MEKHDKKSTASRGAIRLVPTRRMGDFAQTSFFKCASAEDLRNLLTDYESVSEHFVPSVVVGLRDSGLSLKAGQLYGFEKPPALGGEYTFENQEPTDISVHFSLLGQINEQAQNLSPGESVYEVKISDN